MKAYGLFRLPGMAGLSGPGVPGKLRRIPPGFRPVAWRLMTTARLALTACLMSYVSDMRTVIQERPQTAQFHSLDFKGA